MENQTKKNIVIIGSSGHAMVAADIISLMPEYHIAGFTDASRPPGTLCRGPLAVLGNENDLPQLLQAHHIRGGFIAIGDNWVRSLVAARIKALLPDFHFINAIHPSAILSPSLTIGSGNMIGANAVINAGTRIGNFTIINTSSCIEHDNILEDYASVAPGTITGGNVNIGAFTAVGIGAVIRHRINIGAHTIIGAGSLVLKDIPDYNTWYGSPAKMMGTRKAGDKYL
ncbi:acetyltransferase [Chitinophaga sp. Mgbs1]|uniref:Acetyltransferase n=1 Tax=Chitinophaga solisilvae TaxID=1233460 RepID=A0A433WBE2_9BACT|nr:acetyltransferase [Chitinophaga solisilvae]